MYTVTIAKRLMPSSACVTSSRACWRAGALVCSRLLGVGMLSMLLSWSLGLIVVTGALEAGDLSRY